MLEKILEELQPAGARLVAVSKTKPNEAILDLYRRGQRVFGENRVQELLPKYQTLPKDMEWHLIGHLQTNKVKYVVPFVHLIQSADSFKVIKEIDKEARKIDRTVDCLLQFHIADEESKFGFTRESAEAMLKDPAFAALTHIRILGVMGMATYTDDKDQVRREFRSLKEIFERLRERYFSGKPEFREISMGMSGDYLIALEEGSTMVRIGSLLFGER